MRRELGDAFIAVEIDSSPGNPHGHPKNAHSVLTEHLQDREGTPTRAALDQTLAFFREKLGVGSGTGTRVGRRRVTGRAYSLRSSCAVGVRGGDAARDGRHHIGQDDGPYADQDDGPRGDGRVRNGIDLAHEEIPEEPAERDAQRYADDAADADGDAGLPGDGRRPVAVW